VPRHDGASEVHQVPGRFAAARRWCGSVLSLVAVVALVSASGAPHRPGATRVESVAPNVALNTLWNDYGDQSDRWSGADGAASVPLPDGRTAWLFSDTFLGTVNADHSRPRSAPFVNNSIVVQDGRQLTTVTGGTPRRPAALVRPSQGGSDSWYWVGDGTVQGHELKVFYNSYRRVGNGPLDIALTGSALATFQLPTLALREVAPLPGGNRVAWGSAVVEGPRHTYVYGSEIGGAANFAHIARARTGALTSGWEYWAGDGWSGTEAESARLLSGVGTGFSVDRVGGRYLLVTQELRAPLSPHIVAYSATSPIGPFGEPTYLYRAPETGTNRIIYDARLHPELSTPDRLVLSYNANTLDAYEGYWNARIYRPRFVDVTLGDRGGPARAPAPPARVRASSADGAVRLSWDGIDGAVGYRVYMRDMTAGQTGFGRLSYPVVDGTATTVGHLVDGHRYEFVITAFDGATESTPSPVRPGHFARSAAPTARSRWTGPRHREATSGTCCTSGI
jgi:hypothetical protein